jgi:2-hydroxychromene-2-carboxylate isomerase
MKQLTFYFDFISPYAYLAFHQLPVALKGLNYKVRYQPVLFGGLLQHFGQLGPVEVMGKREWTYRQCLWLGRELGIDLQLPSAHPFNPLPLMRLAIATDAQGYPSHDVCNTLFQFVWSSGKNAVDPSRLAELTALLRPHRSPDAPDVKDQLRTFTTQAIEQGVFGVPAIQADREIFWGFDSLPMLRQYLEGDNWFKGTAWNKATTLPTGIQRKR